MDKGCFLKINHLSKMVGSLGLGGWLCVCAKYAYAPKGSSVLLYRKEELRKEQFSVYPNWEGGIYGSTTFLGTKPGGIVASTWMALNHIGEDGYVKLPIKQWMLPKL